MNTKRTPGWAIVRQIIPADEIAALRDDLIAAVLARCALGQGQAFIPVADLWPTVPSAARVVLDPRMGAAAARHLGCERARLYHDQAMFTEAGGVETPWHQDAQHWAVPGDRCVTIWLALVDIPTEMGVLQYLPGLADTALAGDLPIGPASQAYFEERRQAMDLAIQDPGPLRAGDALIHDGYIVHGATPNRTEHIRAVMTGLYVADGTRTTTPAWPAQVEALGRWTPGLEPGDLIAGSTNPRLGS